jgi:glucosyl-dolichyl phosphate glucuronosyltransferase
MKVSVIICAYTEERWEQLLAAVASIKAQTVPVHEIVVIIDHNRALYERASQHISSIMLLENVHERGLSGARNTGLARVSGDIIAFMDEDATAAPDWLEQLLKNYENPLVWGVGGMIEPVWLSGRPAWFPQEFYWVVGCTHKGVTTTTAPIRNQIGCNMSFKREVFDQIGGFRDGIGRVGKIPVGCEETELCIRANQHKPNHIMLFEPKARVFHEVPGSRANWQYFRSRCYSEGISKALVAMLVGAGDGLSSERTYTFRTLPLGVLRGMADTLTLRDKVGILRSAAIVSGLLITTYGYIKGILSQKKLNKGMAAPKVIGVEAQS